MIADVELICRIRELLLYQEQLLAALRNAHPNVRDWKLLLDLPKLGELHLHDQIWTFRRHGCGVMFTNSAGLVVDVHRRVLSPEVFDAWRLLQYMESLAPDAPTVTEAELRTKLVDLSRSGKLILANADRGFALK